MNTKKITIGDKTIEVTFRSQTELNTFMAFFNTHNKKVK